MRGGRRAPRQRALSSPSILTEGPILNHSQPPDSMRTFRFDDPQELDCVELSSSKAAVRFRQPFACNQALLYIDDARRKFWVGGGLGLMNQLSVPGGHFVRAA